MLAHYRILANPTGPYHVRTPAHLLSRPAVHLCVPVPLPRRAHALDAPTSCASLFHRRCHVGPCDYCLSSRAIVTNTLGNPLAPSPIWSLAYQTLSPLAIYACVAPLPHASNSQPMQSRTRPYASRERHRGGKFVLVVAGGTTTRHYSALKNLSGKH